MEDLLPAATTLGAAALILVPPLVQIRRMRGREMEDSELRSALLRLGEPMGVRPTLIMAPSSVDRVEARAALGGKIYLSEGALSMRREHLEFLLRHEMAHLSRRDGLRGVLLVLAIALAGAGGSLLVPVPALRWTVAAVAIVALLPGMRLLAFRVELAADRRACDATGNAAACLDAMLAGIRINEPELTVDRILTNGLLGARLRQMAAQAGIDEAGLRERLRASAS